MLKNIKSVFFFRITFSLLEEKIKLKLVCYNKSIQNKIGINIFNYKLYSKKYIIFEPDGKGKEQDYKNNLIFEGEYINKKRNGKGKEYSSTGSLKFEGEYLDGLRMEKEKNIWVNQYLMENI